MPRRNEPSLPRLFEVIIGHPRIPGFHGLDIEAKFIDRNLPGVGVVKLLWVPGTGGGAPVQWVQAGRRATPWRDGNPDLQALGMTDPRHPVCMLWFAAMNRLHERYSEAAAIHRGSVSVAHEKVMARLVGQAATTFEPVPEMAGQGGRGRQD